MEDDLLDPVPLPARIRLARCSVLGLLVAALLVAATTFAVANEARAAGPSRTQQLRFMWAMAGQESGGDYYARNRSSGAFGKYQIMPFNWPAWAAEFIGDSQADQTPYNQERVAYAKIRNLYRWLGSWKRVAYWWLTGRTDRDPKTWSSYAKGYVDNIMSMRKRAPARGMQMPTRTSRYPSRGDWRRSGSHQKLRLKAAGKAWPKRGKVRDGQVLKVRRSTAKRKGIRWVQVVTADGRLGWLRQQSTVPARRPSSARRFDDVEDRGRTSERRDRRLVRPRPR
ncbi:MAG: hypothetical protein ACC726_01370 [Chloroflexota bacterium]